MGWIILTQSVITHTSQGAGPRGLSLPGIPDRFTKNFSFPLDSSVKEKQWWHHFTHSVEGLGYVRAGNRSLTWEEPCDFDPQGEVLGVRERYEREWWRVLIFQIQWNYPQSTHFFKDKNFFSAGGGLSQAGPVQRDLWGLGLVGGGSGPPYSATIRVRCWKAEAGLVAAGEFQQEVGRSPCGHLYKLP